MTIVLGLGRFSDQLKQAGIDAGDIALKFQKRVALEALTRIVKRTPVDTGFARANWQVAPTTNEGTVDGTDPGGGGTIAGGLSDINKVRVPFGVIWIFNNVKYIAFLEEGSSSQAPQGMVALTLRELEGALQAAGFDAELNFTVN